MFAGEETGHPPGPDAVGFDDDGIGAELVVDLPEQAGQIRP